MSEIKIDKGIPVPIPRSHARYPFRQMEIGDSILMPVSSRSAYQATRHWTASTGFKFTVKTVSENEARAWRTA